MSEILVRFAHISDTHITREDDQPFRPEHYSERMIGIIEAMRAKRSAAPTAPAVLPRVASQRLVEEVNRLPFRLDFVLHTGDIMTDPIPEEYDAAHAILSQINAPVYYLAGNHDNLHGIQSFLSRNGVVHEPYDYTVEINGVVLVCMDSATHGTDHAGHFSQEQIDWLRDICTADDSRPIVVGIHHPVLRFNMHFLDMLITDNGEAVHEVLKLAGSRLRGVFSGHIHEEIDIYQDGILYSFASGPHTQSNLFPGIEEMGSFTAAPNPGFSVVTVTTTGTFIRRYNFVID